MRAFWILFLILPLIACEAEHSSLSNSSSVAKTASTEQVEAFQSTLFAYGQAQGCVKCHATNVNPTWMNPDVARAYAAAAPFVDFSNPTASIFAIYAGNKHCLDTPCADPANGAAMQGVLSSWAEAEVIIGGGGTPVGTGSTLLIPPFKTEAVAVPAVLPLLTATSPAVMRFDLSKLQPPVPALRGAVLEISIRAYSTGGTEYKVSSPRIVGTTYPVSVSGLHVYVRPAAGTGLGVEDALQGLHWANLNSVIVPRALPLPLPAGPLTAPSLTEVSLGIQSQSTADFLTIGFATVK